MAMLESQRDPSQRRRVDRDWPRRRMDPQRNEFSSRRSAVLVTTLGSFLIPLAGSSVNIALPSVGKEFGMDAILLSWVTTSYLLAVASFQVPFGRIADIYG